MSPLPEYWWLALVLPLIAVVPFLLQGRDRAETWSDRVSRERGWPTEPRRAVPLEPVPGDGSAFLDTGTSGGNCDSGPCGSSDSG
jgi:hypothetical protein